MKSVCVFAGSNPGANPAYCDAARQLGTALASRGARVIYGGGAVGLMGAVADATMEAGGQVLGVIPQFLVDREVAKHDISELEIVETMHERKLRMFQLADSFIALPGGIGTLEELFEMLTWAQLRRHQKPCGLLNVAGYFDGLLSFLQTSREQGFVRHEHQHLLQVDNDVDGLLQKMRMWRPAETGQVRSGDAP